MSDFLLFLVFMIPGTIVLGVSDILVRKILVKNAVKEESLLGLVFILAGFFLAGTLPFIGLPEIIPGFWLAFAITASLNIFGQLAYYKAFKREEASLVAPFRLLTPPLVILTGFLVLREALSPSGIAGIFVITAGLAFLLRTEALFTRANVKEVIFRPGIILAILGALLFAVAFPFDKKAVLLSSAIFFSALYLIAIGSVYLALSFLFLKQNPFLLLVSEKTRRDAFLLILAQASGMFLTTNALNFAFVAYAASVKRLWSFWTVLLSGKFLQEKNIGRKLLAVLIMLLGIAIITVWG